MKLLFVLVLVVATQASAQVKTETPVDKLQGKVKSVKENEYHLGRQYGIRYNRYEGQTISVYSETGAEIEVEGYDKHGNADYKLIYTYDAQGNRVACDDYNNGKLETKSTYKYDDHANITEQDDFDALTNKLTKKHVFKYDGSGHQIEFTATDADGKQEFRAANTVNADGKVTEEQYYDADNNPEFKIAYTYDTRGNESVLTYYKPDGTVDFKLSYEYENFDANGNWIKETTLKNGKPFVVINRELQYY